MSFAVTKSSTTVGDRMRWLFIHIPLHAFHNWPLWFRHTVLAFLSSLMPLTGDAFVSVTLHIPCLLILRLNCHLGHKYTVAIFIFDFFRPRQAWRFIQKIHNNKLISRFQFSRKLVGREKPVSSLVWPDCILKTYRLPYVESQTSTNYVRERGTERLTHLNILSQEAGL